MHCAWLTGLLRDLFSALFQMKAAATEFWGAETETQKAEEWMGLPDFAEKLNAVAEKAEKIRAKEKDVLCCEVVETHEELLKLVDKTMPPEEELDDLADFFKIFADSSRIRILFVLSQAEVCVCDLAKELHMTQSAVSHQLRILKASRLVKNRRAGKSVFYSLADDHVRTILAQGREHIRE